jgi:hypothetical protein
MNESHPQEKAIGVNNRYTGSLNGRDKKNLCLRYGQILYQEGRGLI